MAVDDAHPPLDRLADYDAGVLAANEAASLSGHVADCSTCARKLAGIEATRHDLTTLAAPPLPPEVAQRIDDALAREKPVPRPRRLVFRPTGAWASLAAAAIALLFI